MNYQVHELPVELAEDLDPCPQEPEQDIVVNAALLARIKVLESENVQLKRCLESKKMNPFSIEQIQHDLCLSIQYSHHILYLLLFSVSWSSSQSVELLG